MEQAILEPRHRDVTPNNLIYYSILGSLVLHIIILVTVDTKQATITHEPITRSQHLKITIQPRFTQTAPSLPAQTTGIKSGPVTDKIKPIQAPAQKKTSMLHSKERTNAPSKPTPSLDIIHLDKITSDIVKKMTDAEQKKYPESSILDREQNLLGKDLPILPELEGVLKQKNTSIQKFADGMIQVVLPSGRSYCIREADGFDIGNPGSPPPVATNCP